MLKVAFIPFALIAFVSCQSTLLRGINQNDPALVKTGVGEGLSPNALIDGEPPLHKALIRNADAAARALIDAGADLNLADNHGHTPLIIVTGQGKLELGAYMISKGADPKRVDPDGKTLLHYAAGLDRPEFVEQYLKAGLNPNLVDKYGNAPMHDACRFAVARGIVATLLRNGGNPSARNAKGYSPLAYLMNVGNRDRDISKTYALWLIMNRARTSVGEADRKPLVARDLLAAGADPASQDTEGNTLLHLSFLGATPEISRELIAKGADIEKPDAKGNIAIQAVFLQLLHSSDTSLASDIIRTTRNVNHANSLGFTALHFAAILGKKGLVKELLEKGASRDVKNNDGKTAFDLATDPECKELLKG